MLNRWRNLLQHDGYRPAEIEDSFVLRLLSFLTVTVAIGATVQSTESEPLLGISAVLLSGLGFWISWQRRRSKNWWIKIILALSMLAALANFFYGIQENPYDARIPLAHLLIWLQTLHSYDLPRRKDVFYSLWVGLILISVAATTSRSTTFGAYLAVYSLLAVASLLASHLSSQKASPRLLKRLSAPVLGLGFVLGVGVFFAMPRYEGMKIRTFPVSLSITNLPDFDGKIKNPSYNQGTQNKGIGKDKKNERREFDPFAYYGFSTELDLNYRGKLSDEVVMKVRGSKASYWRGMGFDAYDGLRWRMTEPYALRRVDNGVQPLWVRESRELKNNIVPREEATHSFYIERDQSNLVFKASYAEQVFFPTNYVLMDKYGGLRSPIELFSGTTYTVISSIPQFSADRLRTVSWEMLAQKPTTPNYYQLPSALPQRVKDLAKKLTQNAKTPYDAIKLLETHLKQEYPYNLEIPMFPENRDAVDYFLFEQGEGYCEHFASSLAVMARSLGIGTRFVTGYVPGQYNPLTGYFEVRSSDAHGWVEAYFPHQGWVPFDPTPGYAAALAPNRMNEKSNMGNVWEYVARWIPEGLKKVVGQMLEKSLGLLFGVFGAAVAVITFLPLPVLFSLIILIVLALLALVFWRSRRSASTGVGFVPRYKASIERERFVQTYLKGLNQFCKVYDIAVDEGLTPREQTQLLLPLVSVEIQFSLNHWSTRYEAVRYGEAEVSPENIETLHADFRQWISEVKTREERTV